LRTSEGKIKIDGDGSSEELLTLLRAYGNDIKRNPEQNQIKRKESPVQVYGICLEPWNSGFADTSGIDQESGY
jgi:hypothetical protein